MPHIDPVPVLDVLLADEPVSLELVAVVVVPVVAVEDGLPPPVDDPPPAPPLPASTIVVLHPASAAPALIAR
ncbi:MAG TPA: hypothetical protein VHB21_28350, partial [Minicystis sp.]|nr:hypothetical protein [Minicystis sp.]